MMIYITIFCVSFLLSTIFLRGVVTYFPRLGLLDNPKKYGLTRAPIPYPGGLVLPAAIFCGMFLFLPFSIQFVGIFIAGLLLTLVSFFDDRYRLDAKLRLFVHFLCAFIIVGTGTSIDHITSPFGGGDIYLTDPSFSIGGYTFAPLAACFTALWIVFVMNAINLLDGIPGLVSGVGTIASLTLFLLSYLLFISDTTTAVEKLSSFYVGVLALIASGALLAFVRYDFSPPKVIIGDTGAMFIGFMLAILSIISGGKIATTLIVLGLPLIDMIWVVLRRISKGESPISADLNHYHHKLLRLGLTERQALWTFYAISILLGLLSLYLLFTYKTIGKLYTILIITLLIFVTSILLIHKESTSKRGF